MLYTLWKPLTLLQFSKYRKYWMVDHQGYVRSRRTILPTNHDQVKTDFHFATSASCLLIMSIVAR